MPSAMASTHSVNSSREPVRVTRISSQGTTRVPTTSASATNTATFASVSSEREPGVAGTDVARATALASPPSVSASAGSITSASTIARSSTMSQPTAILPSEDCSALRSSSARSSTTVLATDSDRPNTRPAPKLQPSRCAMPAPIAVAVTICATAPGSAMERTDIRSLIEKCRPTPNISRMTPISASWPARPQSPTNPGVNGPTAMPATQVADDGRDPQHVRHQSEQQCKHEADRQQRNERSFV